MNQSRLYQFAAAAAVAAGLFVALTTGLLAYNEWRGKVTTLVNSKEVVKMHDELRKQPKNEPLKERIRQLDLQLRQNTFYRLALSHNVSRSLLWGAAVFLASAHFARTARRRLPNPLAWGARQAGDERRVQRFARYAVAGTFALTAFAAVVLSQQPVQLPERKPAEVAVAETPVRMEEFARQWPAFRGPHGQGVATNAALSLPAKIRWQTEVPLPGMSSPIVWSNAVFLTGATETEDRVFRFDTETGALVWSAAVNPPGGAKPAKPEVTEDTTFAAPTAVSDGRRVYVMFADGLAAAFDFNGKPVWAKNVGPVDNAYGYASSLALYQDRLLIQIDREEKTSRLVALDTRTGRELWSKPRAVAGAWASPVVVEINHEPQLLTCAAPAVIAYHPLNGRELWQNKCLDSDVAPSPAFANGMVVVIAPNNDIIGLQPGATGTVWKVGDGVPEATSPVSDGQRVYIIVESGLLNCFDLPTGKVVWSHEIDDNFYASPTIAGQTLLLLSRKGVLYLLAAGTAYRELGKVELGEECNASPSPVGHRLYVRGKKHLFCVESESK